MDIKHTHTYIYIHIYGIGFVDMIYEICCFFYIFFASERGGRRTSSMWFGYVAFVQKRVGYPRSFKLLPLNDVNNDVVWTMIFKAVSSFQAKPGGVQLILRGGLRLNTVLCLLSSVWSSGLLVAICWYPKIGVPLNQPFSEDVPWNKRAIGYPHDYGNPLSRCQEFRSKEGVRLVTTQKVG